MQLYWDNTFSLKVAENIAITATGDHDRHPNIAISDLGEGRLQKIWVKQFYLFIRQIKKIFPLLKVNGTKEELVLFFTAVQIVVIKFHQLYQKEIQKFQKNLITLKQPQLTIGAFQLLDDINPNQINQTLQVNWYIQLLINLKMIKENIHYISHPKHFLFSIHFKMEKICHLLKKLSLGLALIFTNTK